MRNDRPVLSDRSGLNGPDPIDLLIDDAARRLVAGGPSSSLRGEIRDRVAHRRGPWSFVPAFAGAALLVMVGVIVGALLGSPGEPDRVRPTFERAQGPDGGRPLSGAPGGPDSVRPTSEQRTQALVRRLTDDGAALPQEEEPLIPPITVEPLVTDPLTAVQIVVDQSSGVMPIEIAPLRIEPLQGD